jgi:DNA-binding transcriptional LysR family regulator
MVFVSGADFRAGSDAEVTWEELAREPIIVPCEGSDARRVTFSEFRARALEPMIGAEVNNIEFAKELVRQNKGIALMFHPNVKQDISEKKLKVIRVKDCDIRLEMDVLFNRVGLSPATEELIRLIRERFSNNIKEL